MSQRLRKPFDEALEVTGRRAVNVEVGSHQHGARVMRVEPAAQHAAVVECPDVKSANPHSGHARVN